jgi:XTP/dITP diphosphohydrolase
VRTLVFATLNQGKLRELASLVAEQLPAQPLRFVSAGELGLQPPEEIGVTFRANAALKAMAVARATGMAALADDSGLEVSALGGAPGVYSARYAGPRATDAQNVDKLLTELTDVPVGQRAARFRTVLALVDPYGPQGCGVEFAEGVCDGQILPERRGHRGFGYDPVFYFPPLGCSFAELTEAEKNRVSHRGQALRRATGLLARLLGA